MATCNVSTGRLFAKKRGRLGKECVCEGRRFPGGIQTEKGRGTGFGSCHEERNEGKSNVGGFPNPPDNRLDGRIRLGELSGCGATLGFWVLWWVFR
jgi:hypothetical protein